MFGHKLKYVEQFKNKLRQRAEQVFEKVWKPIVKTAALVVVNHQGAAFAVWKLYSKWKSIIQTSWIINRTYTKQLH